MKKGNGKEKTPCKGAQVLGMARGFVDGELGMRSIGLLLKCLIQDHGHLICMDDHLKRLTNAVASTD